MIKLKAIGQTIEEMKTNEQQKVAGGVGACGPGDHTCDCTSDNDRFSGAFHGAHAVYFVMMEMPL